MDAVIKIVQYTCANALTHHQFMELLKEMEDNEYDYMFFANVHCLSHGRILQRFTVLLTLIQDFLETKGTPANSEQRENITA